MTVARADQRTTRRADLWCSCVIECVRGWTHDWWQRRHRDDFEYGPFAVRCLRNRVSRRLRRLQLEIDACGHSDCDVRQHLIAQHQYYCQLQDHLDDSTIRCGDRVLVDDPLTPGMCHRSALVLGHLGQTVAVRLDAPPGPQDVFVALEDLLRSPSRELLAEWRQLRADAGVVRQNGLRRGHAPRPRSKRSPSSRHAHGNRFGGSQPAQELRNTDRASHADHNAAERQP